jgi:hypothetical protein
MGATLICFTVVIDTQKISILAVVLFFDFSFNEKAQVAELTGICISVCWAK